MNESMNLLTTSEVANLLSVSPSMIRSLVRSGEIQAVKIGSEYRIDEEELRKFIARNKTGAKV